MKPGRSEDEVKAVSRDHMRQGFECLTKETGDHPVDNRQVLNG